MKFSAPVPPPNTPTETTRHLRWLPWLAVVALAVLAATWVSVHTLAQKAERDSLQAELRLTQLCLTDVRQHQEAERLLAQRAADFANYRLVPLIAAASPTPNAFLLWDETRQRGVLLGGPLSRPASQTTYRWQLQLGGHVWPDAPLDLVTADGTFRAILQLETPVGAERTLTVRIQPTTGPGVAYRWDGALPPAPRDALSPPAQVR